MARRTYHPTVEQLQKDLEVYKSVLANGYCTQSEYDKAAKHLNAQIKRAITIGSKVGATRQ